MYECLIVMKIYDVTMFWFLMQLWLLKFSALHGRTWLDLEKQKDILHTGF
jgi:hypothetical protein